MLSHLYLSEYDLVCYVDGNQKIIQEPPSHPIWFKHDRRKDIYEEGQQLIKKWQVHRRTDKQPFGLYPIFRLSKSGFIS